MKKITDNYLFLTKQSDFSSKLLAYFYRRLGIFLCLDLNNPPTVVFTSHEAKIAELYDDEYATVSDYGRAFYDEMHNIAVFNANRYDKKHDKFYLKNEYEQILNLDGSLSYYKYVIPLSDIYHELIHSVQYQYGVYKFDDMVEGTVELFSYFITGQYNIDYLKASVALWYVARYILGLDRYRLYVFIRDSIVDEDFHVRYYMTNKKFVKMIAKNYNGDFKKFSERFKFDFYYYDDYYDEFKKDIQYIHNLIFYKY